MSGTEGDSGWRTEPWVAQDILHRHRDLLDAFTSSSPLDRELVAELNSDVVATLSEIGRVEPLTRDAIAAPLAALVEAYEARFPEIRVDPLRMVISSTYRGVVVAGDRELTDDADLVSFSVTQSVVSNTGIDVTNFVLLAARVG